MNQLEPFLPVGALPFVEELLKGHRFQIKVSRPRQSKLGDFRPGSRGKAHRISVNRNLTPHHFLLTLVHEIAHMKTHDHYIRRVKPHGAQWQKIFTEAMAPILDAGIYSGDVEREVRRYLARPRASCSADARLLRVLRSGQPNKIVLEDLDRNTIFQLGKRPPMRKGERRRVRYLCEELHTGRTFAVHPLAEVEPLYTQN